MKLSTNTKMGIAAYITAIVTKKDGSIKYKNTFKNMILNNGMNALATHPYSIDSLIHRCNVGTGTDAPAETQTGLSGSVVATQYYASGTSAAGHSGGTPDWYHYRRHTYNFTEGAAAGNLTEIGFSAGVNSNYFSRQLFKDEFGDPTTITVLSDEFLTIVYEVRYYPNMTDVTGTVNLEGIDYDYTIRPYNVTSISQFWHLMNGFGASRGFIFHEDNMVSAIGTSMIGAGASHSAVSVSPYTTGDFYREYTASVSPSAANFGTGIGTVTYPFSPAPAFQIGFSPKIPKTNTKKFELTLRITWSRV